MDRAGVTECVQPLTDNCSTCWNDEMTDELMCNTIVCPAAVCDAESFAYVDEGKCCASCHKERYCNEGNDVCCMAMNANCECFPSPATVLGR